MASTKKKPAVTQSSKTAAAPAAPRPTAKKPAKAPAKSAAKKVAPVAKPAAQPLAQAFAKPKTGKAAKVKKPKLVRDSFTIPKAEYAVLDELKQRAGKLARPVKKSELLRAGIKALSVMSDVAFLAALAAVPAIKTGRPSTSKAE